MFERETSDAPVGPLIMTGMLITSQTTEKLDEALAKAQGAFSKALKAAENPAFRRDGKAMRYADISATLDALREPLTSNGIVVTQWPVSSTDDRLHLLTRLSHKGEFMQAEFSAPVVKRDPQGYGSALTYLRRYTLQSILGVATEDDDGNEASGRKPPVDAAEVALKFAADQLAKRTALIESETMRAMVEERVKLIGADGQKLGGLTKRLEKLIGPVNKAVKDANGDPERLKELEAKFKTEIEKG